MKKENKELHILTKCYCDDRANVSVLGVYDSKEMLLNDFKEWLSEQFSDLDEEDISKEDYIKEILSSIEKCGTYYDEYFEDIYTISIQEMNKMY